MGEEDRIEFEKKASEVSTTNLLFYLILVKIAYCSEAKSDISRQKFEFLYFIAYALFINRCFLGNDAGRRQRNPVRLRSYEKLETGLWRGALYNAIDS